MVRLKLMTIGSEQVSYHRTMLITNSMNVSVAECFLYGCQKVQ